MDFENRYSGGLSLPCRSDATAGRVNQSLPAKQQAHIRIQYAGTGAK